MNQFRSIFIVGVLSFFLFGFVNTAKAEKKPRNVMEQKEGYVQVTTHFGFPVTGDGSGFVSGIGGWYQPFKYLGGGTGFSYLVDQNGNNTVGNVYLDVQTGVETDEKKDVYAFVHGGVALDFGLYELGQKTKNISLIGRMLDQESFRSIEGKSAIVMPYLSTGFTLGHLILQGYLSPIFGMPLSDQENRDTAYGVAYRFQIGTGFGDYRGGLSFLAGAHGLIQLNGDENHYSALDLGTVLYIGSLGLVPYATLSIPLSGPSGGVSAVVLVGLSWKFDVQGSPPAEQK